jgi:cobalt/nickel transport system ATP-binding protein
VSSLFRTENLFYRYEHGKDYALSNLNIEIEEGIRTVILGANGAGKSTLFYHFNGIFSPTRGRIYYRGAEMPRRGKKLRNLRSEVAVVLQNPNDQLFAPKVSDDVAFGPKNLGLNQDEVASRVSEALEIAGLTEMKNRSVMQLSYGQRKRVVLAGALAMRPKVLIMDEPTAGLDPQMSKELIELTEELHHSGTTVIFSTHDVDLAYSCADCIHVLRRGHLIYSGGPNEFFENFSEVYLSGMVEPSLYSMNLSMSEMAGYPAEPHPRTEYQLISKTVPAENPGRIDILPVAGEITQDSFSEISAERECTVTGVYGTKARKAASEYNLGIDYYFGADEECIIQSLHGKNVLIYCDANLIGVLKKKIESVSAFGMEIPYSLL